MTKTIYYVAASADGYIADRDGGLAWLTCFEAAEGVRAHHEAFLAGVGALVMGARTYEFLLREAPTAFPYPDLPVWVCTRRALPTFASADLRFTNEPVASVHARAVEAAQGRHVWLVGGGELAAEFVAAGLVDELLLGVAPVLLGAGVPLAPVVRAVSLKLTDVTRFGAGFVELAYHY